LPRPPKPHPLFPPVDHAPGSEEEREIKFVTFVRQTGDGPTANCPGDIPADDITDWSQVTAWWGGGAYKAVAKDEKHRIVRYFPPGGSEWMVFEGDSLPFVRHTEAQRPGVRRSHAAAPHSSVAAPVPGGAAPSEIAASATTPSGLELVVASLVKAVERLEARAAPPAAAQDNVRAAMIKANSDQAIAMMQLLRGNDSGSENKLGHLMLQVFKELRPAAAPPPQGFAELLPVMKAVKELQGPPTAPAPGNDFQPLVDIVGTLMSHDASTKQAEIAARAKETVAAPAERPAAPREEGPVMTVPGLGVVRLLAPEAHLALPSVPVPTPASAPVAPTPEFTAPTAPSPAATAPPVAPTTAAPSAAAPSPPATAPSAAPSPSAAAPRVTAPSAAAVAPAAPLGVPTPGPARVDVEPRAPTEPPRPLSPTLLPHVTDAMRKHAGAALLAISKMPDADRIAAITTLPGVGDLAYPVARGVGQITERSVDAFIAGLETKAPEILVELARQHGMTGSAGA
jgi:hypothetical protein